MDKTITFIRYLFLLGFTIEWLMKDELPLPASIIIILLLTILCQVRYFQHPLRKYMLYLLLPDIILTNYFILNHHSFSIFLAMLFLLDASLFLTKRATKFSISLFLLPTMITAYDRGISTDAVQLLQLFIFGFLFFRYRVMHDELHVAKTRYFSLNTETNEHIRAKNTLESYLSSMKKKYILQERNRISRDIHDTVGHSLTTIIVQLSAIQELSKSSDPQIYQMSGALKDFTIESMTSVRNDLANVKPILDDNYTLFHQLDELIDSIRHDHPVSIQFGISERVEQLSGRLEEILYRSVQEFLTNSIRYSRATRIQICLFFSDYAVSLTMRDNGIGTDQIVPNTGLRSMEERVHEQKGTCSWVSSMGNGFQIQIQLPLERMPK